MIKETKITYTNIRALIFATDFDFEFLMPTVNEKDIVGLFAVLYA
jgi:hypothetical protein